MRLKSVMNHQFSVIPDVKLQRSMFNRSHGLKTTFNSGYIIPIYLDEALPGDTFNLKLTSFARLMPLETPIMDNLYLDTFYFAVPIRLVWTNWVRFCGERDDPDDSIDFSIPQLVSAAVGGFPENTIHDYFGLPINVASLSVNCLFHRAYNLIYNTWFRDENIIDSLVVDTDNGPDDLANYELRRRAKKHDYFTSCLPWPQKGDSVTLPLGDEAPVVGIAKFNQTYGAGPIAGYDSLGNNPTYPDTLFVGGTTNANVEIIIEKQTIGGNDYPNIRADLSEATASTINELRQAFQVQRMLERDARGGSRYIEIIRSHFGVVSPDARLQRPEYLGGASVPININVVTQTSETNTTVQGNLTGNGSGINVSGFVKSFTEHCLILGFANVRGDITYQQGLNRMFSRLTRYDFYWPSLSNIGEQAVLNKEIYCDNSGNDDLVFGYQERYAEYRYKPSQITGQFRSANTNSLDVWHLSQDFGALPTLDQTFIEDDPPIDRMLAVPTQHEILFDGYFDLKCVRPMPVYSVPGLIDHF